MEPNSACLIALLRAYIHGEAPSLEAGRADWEAVYRLARVHSVSGIVYLMSGAARQHDRPAPDVEQALKRDFAATLARAAAQEQEIDRVIRCLGQNGIPHLMIKGQVLKRMYPVQELRTMGDIDLLIHSSDRKRSHAVLLEQGYTAATAAGEVWTYVKGAVRLEIHERLISRKLGRTNGAQLIACFDAAWDHAVAREPGGYTYELSTDFHFLYLIVHMAKHFHGAGCGIRMIMDLSVYLMRLGHTIDGSRLAGELSGLGLDRFAAHMLTLCRRWFGVRPPDGFGQLAMDEGLYRELGTYILSAGTFGYYRRNRFTSLIRVRMDELPGDSPSLLRVYLSICFPGYAAMSSSGDYAYLKSRPVLLPLAWTTRAVRALLLRTRGTLGILICLVSGKKGFNEQADLLTRLGLYDF